MPELRIDPICGRRVYIAEDRAGRPHDYDEAAGEEPVESAAARQRRCPFCAGHEHITPDAVAETRGPNGQWQVRVVPNKFPAVAGSGPAGGVHEVVIESPRHVTELTDLTPDELAAAIRMHRDRLRWCSEESGIVAGIVFKNSGHRAGASLEHIHSQVVALPYVPEQLQAERLLAQLHHSREHRCAFCDFVGRELAQQERIVFEQDGFAAIAAYAGRQPYETWLLPTQHAADFRDLSDEGCSTAAGALGRLVEGLQQVVPGAAYNLMLHTAPFGDSDIASFHWHWELVPRIAQFAGLELGAGVYVNPLSPEGAAAMLRAVSGRR